MGKYKKGILGYFRGKIGTVIGSIWKGINYMRSLPDVSNTEPTPAQLDVRLRFALVMGFLSHIKGIINMGYQRFDKGITPLNAATSYHLRSAITGVSPNFIIDYTKVILGIGDLEELADPQANTLPDAEIKFDWEANVSMIEGSPTDLISFLVFSQSLYKFAQVLKVVPRSALSYTMAVPAQFTGTLVHCYLMATRIDGKEVSASQYLGAVTVM